MTASPVEMAMFPLGSVLLPGALLPLHVFEPRYRRLVEHCLTLPVPEFGVTLIERGSEVGGGDQRTDIGTVARMVQVGRADDGRYAVVAVGERRLRVVEWLSDDPHPRALVDDWPDGALPLDHAEWTTVVERVRRTVSRVRALAVELGDLPAVAEGDLADDPSLASFDLVARAPLGPADTHELLAAGDPAARLIRLGEMLEDAEALLRFRLGGLAADPD